MTTFERSKKHIHDHWGLTLNRNKRTNRGWWNGLWKTGFTVIGSFPGTQSQCRRYKSLKEVARIFKVPAANTKDAQ